MNKVDPSGLVETPVWLRELVASAYDAVRGVTRQSRRAIATTKLVMDAENAEFVDAQRMRASRVATRLRADVVRNTVADAIALEPESERRHEWQRTHTTLSIIDGGLAIADHGFEHLDVVRFHGSESPVAQLHNSAFLVGGIEASSAHTHSVGVQQYYHKRLAYLRTPGGKSLPSNDVLESWDRMIPIIQLSERLSSSSALFETLGFEQAVNNGRASASFAEAIASYTADAALILASAGSGLAASQSFSQAVRVLFGGMVETISPFGIRNAVGRSSSIVEVLSGVSNNVAPASRGLFANARGQAFARVRSANPSLPVRTNL